MRLSVLLGNRKGISFFEGLKKFKHLSRGRRVPVRRLFHTIVSYGFHFKLFKMSVIKALILGPSHHHSCSLSHAIRSVSLIKEGQIKVSNGDKT